MYGLFLYRTAHHGSIQYGCKNAIREIEALVIVSARYVRNEIAMSTHFFLFSLCRRPPIFCFRISFLLLTGDTKQEGRARNREIEIRTDVGKSTMCLRRHIEKNVKNDMVDGEWKKGGRWKIKCGMGGRRNHIRTPDRKNQTIIRHNILYKCGIFGYVSFGRKRFFSWVLALFSSQSNHYNV